MRHIERQIDTATETVEVIVCADPNETEQRPAHPRSCRIADMGTVIFTGANVYLFGSESTPGEMCGSECADGAFVAIHKRTPASDAVLNELFSPQMSVDFSL